MTPAAAVDARGLVKLYGAFRAVDGIDIAVRPQESFAILGPNGAGKTTTMRMLSCLTRRDGGDLAVLGLDPDRDPRALKRRLGVVAQDVNLDLELTVRENLLVYGRYFDLPRAEARSRADDLLGFVELADRAGDRVDRLSGGMRRRLQIARALINAPELVLLDEPTTGLDPQARHLVWERLRALRSQGTTLVVTTHYMEEAARLCDRLMIMDHGRVVRLGAPADLVREEVGREALEALVADEHVPAALAAFDGLARRHERAGDVLVVFGDDAEALRARLDAAAVPHDVLTLRRSTLEDVFLALTGRSLRDDS